MGLTKDVEKNHYRDNEYLDFVNRDLKVLSYYLLEKPMNKPCSFGSGEKYNKVPKKIIL